MYIPPFWAGAIATILTEVGAIVMIAIIAETTKKK